jgi:hypothetical protein
LNFFNEGSFYQTFDGNVCKVFFVGTKHPLVYIEDFETKSCSGRIGIGDKDGNGDPIPDFPREIPLLGDGDGSKLIPTED